MNLIAALTRKLTATRPHYIHVVCNKFRLCRSASVGSTTVNPSVP